MASNKSKCTTIMKNIVTNKNDKNVTAERMLTEFGSPALLVVTQILCYHEIYTVIYKLR